MALDFSKQIDALVKETEAQQTAVFQQSAQEIETLILANTPVIHGFLKSTFEKKINEELSPADRTEETGPPPVAGMTFADLAIGDFITMGFSAIYGPRVHYGFVGKDSLGRNINQAPNPWITKAVTQWPQIVESVTARAKSRAGSR